MIERSAGEARSSRERELADSRAVREEERSFAPRPAERTVRGNQERYLLAERFTAASYPIPYSYFVRGGIDADRLERAVNTVVGRYDVLRSSFGFEAGRFVARTSHGARIPLVRLDADGRSDDEVRRMLAERLAGKLPALTPVELVRAILATIAPDRHVLTLSLHHAVGDGVSMDVFAEEVLAAYAGEPSADAPGPDYYDLVTHADLERPEDRAFWKTRLAGVETVASLRPDLAGGEPRPGELEQRLDYDEVGRIAATFGVTPFTVMSAVAAVVLGRYCGVEDVQVTFQSSGRKPFAGAGRVIGPFSNTLVLRTRLDPGEPFAGLVRRQQESIREAVAHERLPYHAVVRETGVQPRFGINWFPLGRPLSAPGLEISDREFLFYDSNYDLNIRFVRAGDRLRLLFHYDAAQFSADRIDQIARAFEQALGVLAARENVAVGALLPPPPPLRTPERSAETDARLFDAFLDQAARHPGRTALIGSGRTFTYGEVEAASGRLAARLVSAGLGPGDRIAYLAERGPQMVITMLAVLRTGATMVPLDASYPDERIKTLLSVARPVAIVLPRVGETPAWAAGIREILYANVPVRRTPPVDPAALRAGSPDAPAYILFTSGSTGTPKGIATSHRPVLNFLRWQREAFAVGPEDRFTNLCGVAHDMMIRDVFQPLSVGAQLAIPEQETIFKPGALLDWCLAQQPTVTHLTPAMGKLLALACKPGQTLPFRAMFFGGDRLTPEVASRMSELAPAAEIVNFYGATETPQAAAFHRCDPFKTWQSHPVGRGIDSFELRIVDEARRPAPDGAPGEIAVLSPYLSLGYVDGADIRPHATPGAYFTGDLGMTLPSGDVMFLGRADDQVSLRGYRIELEEIAAALRAAPGVREAQALVDGTGDAARLVAFATGDGLDPDALYAFLTTRLPHYMVPADIVCVDRLPLLPNGKLDRRALLALPRPERVRSEGRAARTQTEKDLIAAWTPHLGAGRIGPDSSFAELRGDSLSYVQVLLATEAIVGPLPDDWQTMPIAAVARLGAKGSRWWKWIDSAMLVRAISIVFVVALHLHVFGVGGGATSALILVSGYLIGKLQLREVVRSKSAGPIWTLLARVLAPSAIYTTLFYFGRLALDRPANLSTLLFYSDFVDYRNSAAADAAGHAWFLWFIACFVHILIGLGLFSAVYMRATGAKANAKQMALALLLLALPLRFVLPGLIDPEIFRRGVPALSVYGFLPTTHLATLALGACIAGAEGTREKLVWLAAVVLYTGATFFYVPSNSFLMLIAFGVLLLFAPRVPVPAVLHLPVLVLSGASLFIYLTHQQAAQAFERLGLEDGSVGLLIAAIVFGAGLWLVWQRISYLARRVASRRGSQANAVLQEAESAV